MDLSDGELVYLYQENYQTTSALLRLMFYRYRAVLTKTQAYIYHRFFYLPFALSDLNWLQYQAVATAVANFSPHHNKTFKNYLLALFNWRVRNEIRSCWNKKMATTTQTLPLQGNWRLKQMNTALSFDHENNFDSLNNHLVLVQCIKLLTPIEQAAIQMRLHGYGMQEIMQQMNVNYRQVDNAIQRSVQKLKVMVNKNWLQ